MLARRDRQPAGRQRVRHHLRLVLALVIAACVATDAAALDKVRVGKPSVRGFIFTFAELGMATGIYPANGIEVESLSFGGGGPAHQALAAGSIDFAFGAGSEMQLAVKGAPELAVASIMASPAQIALAVLASSPIKTPADLKGKSVGVTSTTSLTAWCTREMSRRQGWGADGITIAPLGAVEAGMAALIAGNIDGLTGNSDQMLLLEAQGKARIITLFSEFVPDFPAFVIFASRALIDGKPDVVQRFLKGTLETLAFMRTHKAETLKLTQPIMELPDAVANKVYDDEMPTFTDGRFTPTSMAVLRRSMLELGLLAEVPPDNELYTERFLPPK
jgi:NitT/TauT family transport system substrate-binding protein